MNTPNRPIGRRNDWAPKPSISFSTMNTFDECERKYWYYAAPSDRKRELPYEIQVQARLMAWNMLVGQAVDIVIKRVLREYLSTGLWPTDVADRGTGVLSEFVAYTKEFRTEVNERRGFKMDDFQAVDHLYYSEYSKEETEDVKRRVRTCLESFDMVAKQRLLEYFKPAEWTWEIPVSVNLQPVPWFYSKEAPVYASYDFAVRNAEHTMIIDWKTGKKTAQAEERVKKQLHIYAAYANAKWETPLDQVFLAVVWLGAEDPWEQIELDKKVIAENESIFSERHAELVRRFKQVEREPSSADILFPMTDRLYRCSRCIFRACPGYQRAEKLENEDSDDVGDDVED